MEKTNDQINEELIRKAQINSSKIHLKLKDRSFRNGYIKNCYEIYFIFIDDVLGEVPIYFLKVYDISPCHEVRE